LHDGGQQLARYRYISEPNRLRPRQQSRSESRLANGRVARGRLREDLQRPDDRIPVGPARLGSNDGLPPPWRYLGGHGTQPHDALVAGSAGDGQGTAATPDRAGIVAREHRYHNRHETLFPVDDGRDSPDGAGTAGRACRCRPRLGEGPREDRRAAADRRDKARERQNPV
jgi:hypothetical protein